MFGELKGVIYCTNIGWITCNRFEARWIGGVRNTLFKFPALINFQNIILHSLHLGFLFNVITEIWNEKYRNKYIVLHIENPEAADILVFLT